QLRSPARGCPIDPPGEDPRSGTSYATPGGRRRSSARGGDQERCTLRSPLGSSDRATALVTRCVTRTQGELRRNDGADESRQRWSRMCQESRCVRTVLLCFWCL